MTRKDYELIAGVLRVARDTWAGNNSGTWAVEGIAQRLSDALAADNPRFDRERSLRACGVGA